MTQRTRQETHNDTLIIVQRQEFALHGLILHAKRSSNEAVSGFWRQGGVLRQCRTMRILEFGGQGFIMYARTGGAGS